MLARGMWRVSDLFFQFLLFLCASDFFHLAGAHSLPSVGDDPVISGECQSLMTLNHGESKVVSALAEKMVGLHNLSRQCYGH